MLRFTFSSKSDQGSYIVSIAKAASKRIALICSMKFLSLRVTLYLYKSTIPPCMEYCCHVWAGTPSCYFVVLDRLQKYICRTIRYVEMLKYALHLLPLLNPWVIVEM